MLEQDDLAQLPLWYAAFLLSITTHEAAHAFAAWRGGDSTAYHGGQVTLNPLPHVMREPIGTVVMPLLSYVAMGFTVGWASAPYDPSWEERFPRRAALMAAAGPLANLGLAALALAALRIGLESGIWSMAAEPTFDRLVQPAGGHAPGLDALGRMGSILAALNLLLCLFNLVPFPPLDGGAIAAGLWRPMRGLRDRLRESGVGGLLGLVVAWFAVQQVYGPLFSWIVLRTLYSS
jgi:Zn-dependent protease